MWMEEKIGKRVNLERVDEALGTGAEKIATGCPFCRVMFSDGLTQRQSEDKGSNVEILDVSQMLLAAVQRGDSSGNGRVPEEVDALGAGSPHTADTTPTSGTQASGPGDDSAAQADPSGDVSVGGASTGGAEPKGARPEDANSEQERPTGQ
jgi:hypothetical protein